MPVLRTIWDREVCPSFRTFEFNPRDGKAFGRVERHVGGWVGRRMQGPRRHDGPVTWPIQRGR